MGFIYKITNKITKKCYIGETKEKDPEERYKRHLRTIRRGKGCPALRDAMKKHGEENFVFEVLIICFDEDRMAHEKEYIKKYNSMVPNGYNILEGGRGGAGFKGKKHTEDTLKKISESSKRRLETDEALKAHSKSIKKYFENPENKEKHSKAVRSSEKYKQAVVEGRVGGTAHHSLPNEVIKKKISGGVRKYYENKDTDNIQKHRDAMAKARGKPISQYTLDGVFIKTYQSMSEAKRAVGLKCTRTIKSVLEGKTKTSAGFIWKHAATEKN
jgi:group I intron endonuclease